MEPFQAYKYYVALKLHFSDKGYDFFKAGGITKVKKETFERRKDKYFFTKICRRYNEKDFQNFLLANFLKSEEMWIGDLLSDQGQENYLIWKKRNEALEYNFSQDMHFLQNELSNLNRDFNELFKSYNGQHPYILKLSLSNLIGLESFIILNKFLEFFSKFDMIIEEDLIWPSYKRKCLKYQPFLEIDNKKFLKVLKECFLNRII